MADNNLVSGVLAVQLGLATPAQVMTAASAWMADKTKSLAERLEQLGALTPERRALLEGLVAEAIRAHGGDAAKTLATVGGEDALFRSFGGSMAPAQTGGDSAPLLSTPQDDVAVTREQPGHYTIKSEYGRGGQSRVFLAVDEHIGREIALKQLLPEANASESPSASPVGRTTAAAVRFLREARITGRLEHPNIVPVYELGRRADGTHYYTQKLVRGETLRKKLAACKGLPERLRLLGHFLDVCQAMAYAHSREVIHRDLKPDNIMIGEFGETVVLDWGLAKVKGQKDSPASGAARDASSLQGHPGVTVEGHALGTPQYMSPEQALGAIEEVDERSDVWSLGAMLYEILTGRPPFAGDTAYEVIGKVINAPIAKAASLAASAPPELIAISERALERGREKRYPSAKELAAEVEAYQAGGRVQAYEYSAWELLGRFARRNKFELTIMLIVAVPLLYLGVARIQHWRAASEAQARWAQADAALREIDQRMSIESDPAALANLEDQRAPLEEEARRTEVLAESLTGSVPTNPDELDRPLHAILQKFGADTYAIPPIFKMRLKFYVDHIRNSPYTKEILARKKLYWPVIQPMFAALEIPDEMAYIAWQESNFDPLAESKVGARGMWQFMDFQARKYGLQVAENWRDGGLDERTDVAKETTIAARYIADLLSEFGPESFMLAIISYNRGENGVRNVLHQAGFRKGQRNFWHLYRLKLFPDESLEYVPEVLAAAIIGNNPEVYGLATP